MPSDLDGPSGISAKKFAQYDTSSGPQAARRVFFASPIRGSPATQGGRWRLALVPILIALALLGWHFLAAGDEAVWKKSPSAAGTPSSANSALPPWLAANRSDKDNGDAASGKNDLDPRVQHALWLKRSARAQQALDNYREVSRYPHDSRAAEEHADQIYPNQPVEEDKRLYKPGDELKGNVRLRTSQQRIFVAGEESVLFTLSAHDGEGKVLPISIISAGIVDPPQGGKPSTYQRFPVAFDDAGADGDAQAGDGTYSLRFTPSTQGFANYTGQLRLDMTIEVAGQAGYTFFDMYYTPEPPAIWAGSIRESVESGSLYVYLKVQVRQAGRYVATGRFDDVAGKPFALAVFNQELAAGTQEIAFRAFGKLLLDARPSLPLQLRDIDGFRLMEDAFPDRALMPRLQGLVYTTKRYPPTVFSAGEWQSEERERYSREYRNDVDLAKAKLDELSKKISAPPGR